MLGGASIFLLVLFIILRAPQIIMLDTTRLFFQWLSSAVFIFVMVLSYPHFIWSYKAAYQQGSSFILRHAIELVIAPVFLLALLFVCISSWNQPVTTLPFILNLDLLLRSYGFDLHWSMYRGCGQLLLANLFICQTVLAAQHYCMQAYGVSMQGAKDGGLKISMRQKLLLKINLYALAAMNLFSGYTFFAFFNTSDFIYHPVKFPDFLSVTSVVLFLSTGALLIMMLVIPNYNLTRKMPPMTASVPVISVWLWLQPFNQPFGYQAWVVPLAHGAQYLFFAQRVENSNLDAKIHARFLEMSLSKPFFIAIIYLCLIFTGFFAFNFVPVLIDQKRLIPGLNCNFFLLAAFIFLSLHHYFIDAILWKKDSRAQALLQVSL